MNRQELTRYLAGRCDAHGNRMIAFDRSYLRGHFAAFINTSEKNPYLMVNEIAGTCFSKRYFQSKCDEIDRQVETFLATKAFNSGKEAL